MHLLQYEMKTCCNKFECTNSMYSKWNLVRCSTALIRKKSPSDIKSNQRQMKSTCNWENVLVSINFSKVRCDVYLCIEYFVDLGM